MLGRQDIQVLSSLFEIQAFLIGIVSLCSSISLWWIWFPEVTRLIKKKKKSFSPFCLLPCFFDCSKELIVNQTSKSFFSTTLAFFKLHSSPLCTCAPASTTMKTELSCFFLGIYRDEKINLCSHGTYNINRQRTKWTIIIRSDDCSIRDMHPLWKEYREKTPGSISETGTRMKNCA